MPAKHAIFLCAGDVMLSAQAHTFAAVWKLFTLFPSSLPSSGSLLGPAQIIMLGEAFLLCELSPQAKVQDFFCCH